MNHTESRTSVGPVRIGVVVLALATAAIHLYLFVIEGFLGNGEMLPLFQFLFVGNFFAYAGLVAAMYAPISSLARFRPFARILLIALALASIVSYFDVGVLDALGNADKVIEVLLIALATADAGMSGDERFTGGGAKGAFLQLAVGVAVGVGMFLILTIWIGN
jgi:hypothetical protein